MKFSILAPKYIDNTGNILKTKFNLDSISQTKNFELDDEDSYLCSSDFSYDELCSYITTATRNVCCFKHDDLKKDHYIEAAIVLPLLMKDAKYVTNANSLIVIRQRDNESQVMVKSSSIKKLFEEINLLIEQDVLN